MASTRRAVSRPKVRVSPSVDTSEARVIVPPVAPKLDDVFKVAPIVTLNDWVLIVPFMPETTIHLPMTAEYRNIGIVVGKSEAIMSPSGNYVPSRLEYGMVVLFQKKSVIGEMGVDRDPYVGKKIVILSEKNIICRLPSVPFQLLDYTIGVGDLQARD